MSSAEQRYYRTCIANNKPYFGRIMRASQGSPIRHAYMQAQVELECRGRGGKPYHILEIGSWAGGSAITWADAIRRYNGGKGSVVCIDPWQPYFKPEAFSDIEDVNQYNEMADALANDKIYNLFLHNIRSSGNSDIVKPVRGYSRELLPAFEDGFFDLIFVDGAHDYENVKEDLKSVARVVREGGIVCGDDLELQIADMDIEYARSNKHRDYIQDAVTRVWFHPGVSLAIGEYFGDVSSWEGFWSMRKRGDCWEKPAPESFHGCVVQVPVHLKHLSSICVVPELVESEYKGYNILLWGHTYCALALSLGNVYVTELPEDQLLDFLKDRTYLIGASLEDAKWIIDLMGYDSRPGSIEFVAGRRLEALATAAAGADRYTLSGRACLRFDGSGDDCTILRALFDHLTHDSMRPAFYGLNALSTYILNLLPEFINNIACIIDEEKSATQRDFEGIPIVHPEEIPDGVDFVFICETDLHLVQRKREKLPHSVQAVCLHNVAEAAPQDVSQSVSHNRGVWWEPGRESSNGVQTMTEEDRNVLFRLAAGEPLNPESKNEELKNSSNEVLPGYSTCGGNSSGGTGIAPNRVYEGFNIFVLESRFFAVPRDCPVTDIESIRANAKFVGLAFQEVETEIDKFSKEEPMPAGRTARHREPFRFSFLLPTRGRPDLVDRLFRSIVDTTSSLDQLEIILGIDDDDQATQKITHDRLNLKKVILPRGQKMGALVSACYAASSGRFIMGVNDDLILRTQGWDEIVASCFERFGDDIGLIHVNDLLFRDVLCTFPILSRRACKEIGFSPAEYKRYKIDDHIYDTYNLLAYLGYKRITYLPDVIFEHENHGQVVDPKLKYMYISADNKVYVPDQDILARDDEIFHRYFEARKEAALKLAALIEGDKSHRIMESRRRSQTCLLKGAPDPYSYRRKDFTTSYSHISATSKALPRTTIAVVTADIRSEFASRCVSLVKQHTPSHDLIVLDNSRDSGFSHPREMNKVMRAINTDLLVLLDDDVFVEPGWFEGLARCLDERTAVVAPLHKDKDGKISFTGGYLAGDGLGTHEHTFDVPSSPRSAQSCCSAAILIDMKKCGQILMEEAYKKYFFDIVHSFEVWEAGYRVVVTPEVTVTHVGGATAIRGSASSSNFFEIDRKTFINQWVETGRLARLEEIVWQKDPYLALLVGIPREINRLYSELETVSFSDFIPRAADLLNTSFKTVPHRNNLFVQGIEKILSRYISLSLTNGDPAGARACVSSLSRYMKDASNGSDRFGILKDLERMHIQVNTEIDRFEKAVEIKRSAIEKYAGGDMHGAEQTFLKAFEMAPRDANILACLGQICYESRRYADALTCNKAAIRLNPEEIDAWIGLALIARATNSPDALKSACEQIRILNPHHPKMNELMGELPEAAIAAAGQKRIPTEGISGVQ